MASTFYGLTIASSGIFTARKQIDISGHNIANVNTPGYTRQRLMTASIDPPVYEMKWAPLDDAHVGQGVKALSLDQIRDKFLDIRYRHQNSDTNYWGTRSDQIAQIEDIFYPSDGNNISDNMSKFFAAWNALEGKPNDIDARKVVRQSGLALVENLNRYQSKLSDVMYQQDNDFVNKVNQINTITAKMVELNDSIYRFEVSGQVANDLRDKRNLLLDELSGLINIEYEERADALGNSMLSVTIPSATGGSPFVLVDHKDRTALTLSKTVADPLTGASDSMHEIVEIPYDDIVTGQLRAHLDLRDGDTNLVKGVPYYADKLNLFVESLVNQVNEVHRNGFSGCGIDLGVEYTSSTGINFFDPAYLTAGEIRLSDELMKSAYNIAASSKVVTLVDGKATGDAVNVLAMQALRERSDIPGIGNFTKYYNALLGELLVDVNHADDLRDTTSTLLNSIDNQRISISGVSLDEEMTDMIRFQHAYNAASRSLTTMDECLDLLIMRTGVVGR